MSEEIPTEQIESVETTAEQVEPTVETTAEQVEPTVETEQVAETTEPKPKKRDRNRHPLAVGQCSKGEILHLYDLDKIVVDFSLRRRKEPPSAEEVQKMVVYLKQYGQLQPVVLRALEDRQVKLVAGFTRYEAVKAIQATGEKFALTALVYKGVKDDQEAQILAIVENLARSDHSAIDDAFNMKYLIDTYDYTQQQVADLFQCSLPTVSNYLKLLTLDLPTQHLVHKKQMTVTAALGLMEVQNPAERTTILELATDEKGQVNTGIVKEFAAEARQEQGKSKGNLTLKQLRGILDDWHADEELPQGLRDAVKDLTLCIYGQTRRPETVLKKLLAAKW